MVKMVDFGISFGFFLAVFLGEDGTMGKGNSVGDKNVFAVDKVGCRRLWWVTENYRIGDDYGGWVRVGGNGLTYLSNRQSTSESFQMTAGFEPVDMSQVNSSLPQPQFFSPSQSPNQLLAPQPPNQAPVQYQVLLPPSSQRPAQAPVQSHVLAPPLSQQPAQAPVQSQVLAPPLSQPPAQAPVQSQVLAPPLSQPPAQAPVQFSSQAPAGVPIKSHAPAVLSTPFPGQAPAPATTTSDVSRVGHPMHKNSLQQYTQRSGIPLPIYQTVNEGLVHAPRYRSTVFVDGAKYTSSNTYPQRKAAEQDVAELALKCILKKVTDEGHPLILEDTVFCKQILNEFATKMKMELPTYTTVQPEGLIPVFVSSLVFNGASYTGGAGRSKKEAEQLAARTVILSLLGDYGPGKVLYEIIKSKIKLYAAIHKVNSPLDTTVPLTLNTGHSSENEPGKDVQVETMAVNPPTAVINNTATDIVPDSNGRNVPPRHEFKAPSQETSSNTVILPEQASQATNLPIEFVHPVFGQDIGSTSSRKRRKNKNKKKADKKLCPETQLPIATTSISQTPPCPVTQ